MIFYIIKKVFDTLNSMIRLKLPKVGLKKGLFTHMLQRTSILSGIKKKGLFIHKVFIRELVMYLASVESYSADCC